MHIRQARDGEAEKLAWQAVEIISQDELLLDHAIAGSALAEVLWRVQKHQGAAADATGALSLYRRRGWSRRRAPDPVAHVVAEVTYITTGGG